MAKFINTKPAALVIHATVIAPNDSIELSASDLKNAQIKRLVENETLKEVKVEKGE